MSVLNQLPLKSDFDFQVFWKKKIWAYVFALVKEKKKL